MTFRSAFLSLLIGAGAVAAMAVPASAWIACNREGDCWHTDSRYAPPGLVLQFHPDDWYFHRRWDNPRWHWREYHPGRGYWRNGVWITL